MLKSIVKGIQDNLVDANIDIPAIADVDAGNANPQDMQDIRNALVQYTAGNQVEDEVIGRAIGDCDNALEGL